LAHHPDEKYGYRNGPDDDPGGVAPRIAALYSTQAAAALARKECQSVHRAVDQAEVDHFPENIARNPDQRADDDRAVELVDVVLVQKEFVNGPESIRELVGTRGLANIQIPRDQETYQPRKDGDAGHLDLEGVRRLNPGRVQLRGEFPRGIKNGREEALEVIGAAPVRRQGEPAADDRQGRENHKRHKHHLGRFVHVYVMLVVARLAMKGEK